jgi:hypothetical protein
MEKETIYLPILSNWLIWVVLEQLIKDVNDNKK